jgi:hypothetical protein
VAQLVDDDASLEVAVSVRQSRVPEVHAHASILTVRWGHEVGIVESRAILGIGDDGVVTLAATSKVVLLEVPRDFVEAVPYRLRLAYAVAEDGG